MKKFFFKLVGLFTISLIVINASCSRGSFEGAAIVSQNGYDGCIELSNGDVRVVLEPNMGGRVLIYEKAGVNVLYSNPEQNGVIYEPGKLINHPSGGRFDIGPEKTIPKRPLLFFGRWDARITGKREAELTSQPDSATGVRLVRSFRLADSGSRLECTQTIVNISNEVKHYCFWSRTFAKGGGISLTPLNPNSRYPKGYIIYGPGTVMDFMPAEESAIRVRDGILEIVAPPSRPKFVMDNTEGWMAYITRDNQLFIKTYPVYPDRIYGEMAAATSSVWYNGLEMCEIEPIGPMESIRPGRKASFTEIWYLTDFSFPEDGYADLKKIRDIISTLE
jgi:hypothetical protein